ncbi:GxxExxY protein [Anaerolineales bacterium HSG6]|nr:GxxExxY protein [Anaerolineales bacterium HSG6]MDM8529715.1 GxxExxY protein [Anaerolineales bacterium HSG25]
MGEVRQRGISVIRQDKHEITYKNYRVGWQELDLFIGGEIVVENKAVERLTRLHKAQCISYIKAVDKMTDLLLNFAGSEPSRTNLFLSIIRCNPVFKKD